MVHSLGMAYVATDLVHGPAAMVYIEHIARLM
jgi:hypothetical protein